MQSWRELEGSALDGRVRLDRLVSPEPSPVFSAHLLEGHDLEVVVRFLRERTAEEQMLARWLEASYLAHPNLVRCFGAGLYESGNSRYVYVITEGSDATLSQMLQQHPLPLEEVRDLGRQLANGLLYLHERNLVCCSLDTSSVVRSGRFWKIGDYSQLRVAGATDPVETRRLLASSPSVPPEAYEGIVSPAWDAWSLATVLTAALDGPKPERRDGRSARRDYPAPVESIVSECLSADPQHRCGVERIAELLKEDATPRTEPVPETAPPPPARKRRWPVLAAGAAAVAAGALLAAITLNSDRPSPPQPRPAPAPAQAPKSNAPAVSGDQDRTAAPAQQPGDGAQIYSLLNGWVTASRNRNLDAQASYYAPEVDAFYGARHVTRDWVKKNREKTLSQVGEIRELNIDNVHVKQDRPDHAIATFDKSWDFGGGYSGKVKQQLDLRKLDGTWQITAERDVRVYRLHTGRGRRPVS